MSSRTLGEAQRSRAKESATCVKKGSTRSDFPRLAPAPSRRRIVRAHAANLLSASRFVLAGAWLAVFMSGDQRPEILGPIALAGAISDFADGRVARRMRFVSGFGQWLDSLADIVFVLTALACEAQAGALPAYIPALIAASFTQYVIDSVMISGSSTLLKSRLGHYGGVINFALVILLAFAPPPLWPGMLVRGVSPLIAIFYLAAISERALSYRLMGDVRLFRWTRAS